MIGAITGDIVGSRFEWNNHKFKKFDLFAPACSPTDDSIMALAIAKALISCDGDYTRLGEKAVYWMRRTALTRHTNRRYQSIKMAFRKTKSKLVGMYIRELTTFITVAEQGSFLKTSRELYITPASVMNQINKLESLIGVKLIERTNQAHS